MLPYHVHIFAILGKQGRGEGGDWKPDVHPHWRPISDISNLDGAGELLTTANAASIINITEVIYPNT